MPLTPEAAGRKPSSARNLEGAPPNGNTDCSTPTGVGRRTLDTCTRRFPDRPRDDRLRADLGHLAAAPADDSPAAGAELLVAVARAAVAGRGRRRDLRAPRRKAIAGGPGGAGCC